MLKNSLMVVLMLSSVSAFAADFRCSSGRVEKGSSTMYTYRASSSEIVIEKASFTRGKAVKRGTRWYVEVQGSTVGAFEKGRIDTPGGSTWAKVEEARRTFDCTDDVAATLWILKQKGAL